jgi:hypothetical protein
MQEFAETCADQNSTDELLEGLEPLTDGSFRYLMNEASLLDCIEWDLTPREWVGGLNLAVLRQLTKTYADWKSAEVVARALARFGIEIDGEEAKDGTYTLIVTRGMKVLRQMAEAVPTVEIQQEN